MTKPILPNPYQDMSLASRAGAYDVLDMLEGGDPLGVVIDAEAAVEYHETCAAFDLNVLPVLLDPASFMAMPPTDRLRAVVDFVTIHPEKHEQGVWAHLDFRAAGVTADEVLPDGTELSGGWATLNVPRPGPALSCGTSACLAGWAAQFSGARPVTYLGRYGDLGHVRDEIGANGGARLDTWISRAGGEPRTAAILARNEVFGLRYCQPEYLFSASNSTATLRAMVAAIEADPAAVLDDIYLGDEHAL